ncbi:MAG TPA: beta-ketoacyl-ACP reductase [Candidatus Nanoarchaeia archaeon]|nr:beta-ketoacyl-ACP reductase [Candidatus Nanoarchaeia archaeon]
MAYVSSRKSEKPDYYKEKLGLKGKIALVTGASRGIGKAIAIELAKNGAKVIVNYNKNEAEANAVLNEVKKLSDGILIQADVSDFESAKSMALKIKESFSKIDILVNNAGIITDKTMQNMSYEEWRKVIHTNLDSVFNVTKNILPLINENGRIINISSIVALDGNFGQCNYAASKAGIIGFTKSLAKEVSRKKITVNAVAPGLIETDILGPIPANVRREFNARIPIGRSGEPQDVANLVAFLSSEMAGYITAEVIPINGGLHF